MKAETVRVRPRQFRERPLAINAPWSEIATDAQTDGLTRRYQEKTQKSRIIAPKVACLLKPLGYRDAVLYSVLLEQSDT